MTRLSSVSAFALFVLALPGLAVAGKDPCKGVVKVNETAFGTSSRAGADWFGTPLFMFEKKGEEWRLLVTVSKPGALQEALRAGASLDVALADGTLVNAVLAADVPATVQATSSSIYTQFRIEHVVTADFVKSFVPSATKGLRILVDGKEWVALDLWQNHGEKIQKAATCLTAG